MPTANRTNCGTVVTEIVRRSALSVARTSTQLHDCRLFYWKVIGHCNARISGSTPTFHLPIAGSSEESMLVVLAINEFERMIDDGYLNPAEKISAYKKLHRALSAHVYQLEERCDGSMIASLDDEAF